MLSVVEPFNSQYYDDQRSTVHTHIHALEAPFSPDFANLKQNFKSGSLSLINVMLFSAW